MTGLAAVCLGVLIGVAVGLVVCYWPKRATPIPRHEPLSGVGPVQRNCYDYDRAAEG